MMRRATKLIIIGVTIVLIAYDIVAYLLGVNATISVVLTDWSYYTPWIPFIAGCLMGHWFLPPKRSIDK